MALPSLFKEVTQCKQCEKQRFKVVTYCIFIILHTTTVIRSTTSWCVHFWAQYPKMANKPGVRKDNLKGSFPSRGSSNTPHPSPYNISMYFEYRSQSNRSWIYDIWTTIFGVIKKCWISLPQVFIPGKVKAYALEHY